MDGCTFTRRLEACPPCTAQRLRQVTNGSATRDRCGDGQRAAAAAALATAILTTSKPRRSERVSDVCVSRFRSKVKCIQPTVQTSHKSESSQDNLPKGWEKVEECRSEVTSRETGWTLLTACVSSKPWQQNCYYRYQCYVLSTIINTDTYHGAHSSQLCSTRDVDDV